jgi:hypothetical protein
LQIKENAMTMTTTKVELRTVKSAAATNILLNTGEVCGKKRGCGVREKKPYTTFRDATGKMHDLFRWRMGDGFLLKEVVDPAGTKVPGVIPLCLASENGHTVHASRWQDKEEVVPQMAMPVEQQFAHAAA